MFFLVKLMFVFVRLVLSYCKNNVLSALFVSSNAVCNCDFKGYFVMRNTGEEI